MSPDIIVIIIFCVMGLMAHGARNHPWMEWALRVIIGFTFAAELYAVIPSTQTFTAWQNGITWVMAVLTGGMLFKPVRDGLSTVITVINQFICGRWLVALFKKQPVGASFLAERIFVSTSIPHLNGLYIYVTVLGSLLAAINPVNIQMPNIPVPLPVPLDALFSYNFLGLIILSFCGCGIFVSRKFKEVLVRLGLVKPTGRQVLIGILAIFVTMAYDATFALLTHSQGLAPKIQSYNENSFGASGGGPAFILALATGLCAGIGEETLIRGALQPVFGALFAGILHGALHGQFNHAPQIIIQVAIWSTMMGVLRRYTNTTTTIITHVGWNFIMTFLIAFNP